MRKLLLALALLIGAQFTGLTPANAVCGSGGGTCFVVAGGGSSNVTSTWSASTGGGSCTCVPAATDNVILDSAAGQLTIAAAFSIANFDASGTAPGNGSPYAGTLTHNAFTWTVSGTLFKLVAGMTYNPAAGRLITFTANSGTTVITTAGKTLGALTLNGSGGTFQFADNLSVGSITAAFTWSAGTLDAATNNVNITTASFSGNGGSGTINGGTGTWTINGRGAGSTGVFDMTVDSGLSNPATAFSSTHICICVTNPNAGRQVTLGNSMVFLDITLSGATTPAANVTSASVTLKGAATPATITTLTITSPLYVIGTGAQPITMTNAPVIAATTALPVLLNNNDWTSTATPTYSNVSTLQGIYGGSTWTFNNAFDFGGNAGTFTVNPPVAGGGGGHIIGG